MVGVGRDLCGSSSSTLLPKQGHPEQAAQDLVQAGLEYLQTRRIHNLPGQPVPGLRHPQSKEVLPHVWTELPLLQFVPVKFTGIKNKLSKHRRGKREKCHSVAADGARRKTDRRVCGNLPF